MTDGSQAQIEHAAVDTWKETLGVCTSPVGDYKDALETMQNKAEKCIDTAKESTLSRHDVWFPLDTQLCPRFGYGISSNNFLYHKITDCIKNNGGSWHLWEEWYVPLRLGHVKQVLASMELVAHMLGLSDLLRKPIKCLCTRSVHQTLVWRWRYIWSTWYWRWESHCKPYKSHTRGMNSGCHQDGLNLSGRNVVGLM